MTLSKRSKIIVGVGVIAAIVVVVPLSAFIVMNANSVHFQLLDIAGVKIEAFGMRIYVDPYNLPSNFRALPADVILVTHPHVEHYDNATIEMLQKDGTVNVFPESMSEAINLHAGIGVNPEDELEFGSVKITAFYAYYPRESGLWTHLPEWNWTSYIIDINGLTFFLSGDSKNIPEYAQLTGMIDVACLCSSSLAPLELVDVLDVIRPSYYMLTDYEFEKARFLEDYASSVTHCTMINLEYYQSYAFPQ
ncbi:MAG: MBL fold metallo-hydrolase [Candidatus Hermodarchaeota archaeon]